MFRLRTEPTPPPVRRVVDSVPHPLAFVWIRGAGGRMRIEVAPDGEVRVHTAAGASAMQAEAFVREKAAWIFRTREKIGARERLVWPAAPRDGEEYFWAGRRLGVEESAGRRFAVRIEGDRLAVIRPASTDADRAARRAGRGLREEAERILGERLARCLPEAGRFGLPPGRRVPGVSFRMMKRRWGSCGRDGRIVLNIRLAQIPEACADYVILHELCHLRHHHHGREFYRLLDRVCPDWRERKKKLERFVPASSGLRRPATSIMMSLSPGPSLRER